MRINIIIKRLEHAVAELPSYSSIGASGIDIRSSAEGTVGIAPGYFTTIPSGYCCELGDTDKLTQLESVIELQVRSRSGLAAKHGIFVLNSPGTIDSDYRGEIKVILANFGHELFMIYRGDRIAQLVPAIVPKVHIELASKLTETKRGAGGFGSTGLN